MSNINDNIRVSIQIKGTEAFLQGLTRDDNPYTVRTPNGRKWARVWLQAYGSAEHGIPCDACKKWLSNERGYHYVCENGFVYWLCATCGMDDVKPLNAVKAIKE